MKKYAVALAWTGSLIDGYKVFFSFEDYKKNIGYRHANSIYYRGEWLTRLEVEKLCCDIVLDLRQNHSNIEYSLVIIEDIRTNYNSSYEKKE